VRALLLIALLSGCAAPPESAPFDGPAWVFFADRVDDAAPVRVDDRARRRRQREGRPAALPADRPVDPSRLQALEDLGLTVRTTSRWLNAASVEAVADAWPALRSMDGVLDVRPVALAARLGEPGAVPRLPDLAREEPPPSPIGYGAAAEQVAQIRADALHGLGLTGEGVVVAITDTGFRLDHEALVPLLPRVLGAFDAIHGDDTVGADPDDDPRPERHGTLVLSALAASLDGTLVGVAPGVSLLLVKTESTVFEDPVEEDRWIAGVEWAEAEGADVLTSSLGWFEWYPPEDLDGATATSTRFINALVEATGLLVTVSAANRGPDPQTLAAPADSPFVLAVAAANPDGSTAAFSSRGPTADGRTKPDVAARGVDVAVVDWEATEGLGSGTGTSFATPLVAGGVALLRQAHPDWTRAELFEALRASGSRADAPDNAQGWGVIDLFSACGLRCSCRDEDGDGHYADDCGGDDCDDGDPGTAPGAPETCDGLDTSCAGLDPSEIDGDGDGSLPCGGDCDDGDPALDGLDRDGDGATSCGGDCDDGDAARAPGAPEVPYDGVDQDCDGVDAVDLDGDGFPGGPSGSDCRDQDPATYPDPPVDPVPADGGHELCGDGRDNDCDGLRDGEDPDCAEAEGAVAASGEGCSCSTSTGSGGGLLLLLLVARRRRYIVPGSRVPSFVQ
jgi:serine protease AprX